MGAEGHAELCGVVVWPGGRLLVCADGLWGVGPETGSEQRVAAGARAEAVGTVVAAANTRGGPENVTAVIAEIPARPATSAAAKSLGSGAGTLALVLLIALVAALGALTFQLWN